MTFLKDCRVVAIEDAADGALARLLTSFDAIVQRVGVKDVLEAVASADFLIDRLGLTLLADAGVERGDLERINPELIHTSVTPFGGVGPYARWRGSELTASAMGGALRLTGEPDRPPVKEALDACWFQADMVAAAGAFAAYYERVMSGRGQQVDVSVQEVAFSRNVNGVLVWAFDRRKLHRVGGALNYGRAAVRCIWPLADGYCFHTLMTGRFGAPANQALSDWMDESGSPNPLHGVDWTTYNRSTLPADTRARWEDAIESFFATRTREDINTEGRRRGINATVIAEPRDVLEDPHLQARGFWREESGRPAPSRFVSVTPGPSTSTVRPAASAGRPGPLAGVRVLDFSWALVGSITTKVLGDLGCDVVKIESRGRPCLSRLDVQVGVSRADNFDDKPWFAHLNTSKRSLALDMKRPESRSVLDPLIDWADVVVENFSPGTMAKLGLDYTALSQRNPAIIMVSGSVYGQTGPLSQAWGVDGTGAALSGRTFLTGWPDRGPVIPGAVPYGDVIVPYVMAAAAAGALAQRRRTGVGCHIDASMYEICVQQMAEAIALAARGARPMRMGNDDPSVFHQGVYPAAGDDRWVAITAHTQREWRALCALAGVEADRVTAQARAALVEWTRIRDERELVATLQRAAIAAGVVQDIEDLMERDPQLAARGALMTLDHPLLGPFGHVRTPITYSRTAVAPYRAPRLGEHSEEIVRTLCGASAERFTELSALGVFR